MGGSDLHVRDDTSETGGSWQYDPVQFAWIRGCCTA
jgi:hypothetical protein